MSHDHYPANQLAQAAWTCSKHISYDRYLLLCDITADMENTVSSIVCWTVFTELLPGNALIKSVTVLYTDVQRKEWAFTLQYFSCSLNPI
jgi:hypothetical protein